MDDPRRILLVMDNELEAANGVVTTVTNVAKQFEEMGHQVTILSTQGLALPMPGTHDNRFELFPYNRVKDIFETFRPNSVYIATEATLGRAARNYCRDHHIAYSTGYHTQVPEYLASYVRNSSLRFRHVTQSTLGNVFAQMDHEVVDTHLTSKRQNKLAGGVGKILNRFDERVNTGAMTAASWVEQKTYENLRRFHGHSYAVMAPTESMAQHLRERGFQRVQPWTRGVDEHLFHPLSEEEKTELNPYKELQKPVWLYVGRVSVEKNIGAFLNLDLPGTKVVVGDGPHLQSLKTQYPDVVFTGAKKRTELAPYYACADTFIFPSRTDTFGNVMLEALACGTPVAAYPVTGPKDVLRDPNAGVTNQNLQQAALDASQLQRDDCLAFAKHFTWKKCAEMLLENLPYNEQKEKKKPWHERLLKRTDKDKQSMVL